MDFSNHLTSEYNRLSAKEALVNDVLDSKTDP